MSSGSDTGDTRANMATVRKFEIIYDTLKVVGKYDIENYY